MVEGLEYKELTYKIGKKSVNLPVLPDRELHFLTRRSGRIHPKVFRHISEIRDMLKGLVNVSYLSVHRDNVLNEDSMEVRREDMKNVIDIRLEELMNQLTSYQLQLETELARLSKKFQEEVLRSMLYNIDFDKIDISRKVEIDLKSISAGLTQAYNGLGILDENTKKSIEEHIAAIEKAAKSLNSFVDESIDQLAPEDITPLTLLSRTEKINSLSSGLEANKKEIFKHLNIYIQLLNDFHKSKTFSLQDTKIGGISILKDEKDILLSELSSGEKQLIILLTETLLQKGKQTLFIADEPELSLHIEWQRKVLSSIQKLNPNSQIIVATHSPEIVGNYKNSMINMERVVYG